MEAPAVVAGLFDPSRHGAATAATASSGDSARCVPGGPVAFNSGPALAPGVEYPAVLLDHYRSPRHRRRLQAPDATVHLKNPLCGDEVTMDVRGGRRPAVGFDGVGCAICIGSADMAAEAFLRDGPAAIDIMLDDVPARIGMDLPPGRVRCATLGWEALVAAWRRLSRP